MRIRAKSAAFTVGPAAACAMLAFWAPATELLVDGIPLSPSSSARPALEEQAAAWLDTRVTIDAGLIVENASRRTLGARIDVAAAVDEAACARTPWGAFTCRSKAGRERSGRIALPWHVRVERNAARAYLEHLRQKFSLESPTTFHLFDALAVVERQTREGRAYIKLPMTSQAKLVRPAFTVQTADFTDAIATFETRYPLRGDDPGRGPNIERAAQLVDGIILYPEDEFSFNATVGARTMADGFRPALEVSNGELVEGIGGGVCQVAGTLYAAALRANLRITERHAHSVQNEYIAPDLDAMVAWPAQDLRFRNTRPVPIRLRAVASQGNVRITIDQPALPRERSAR